ncbi:phage baseplate assembly protein [Ampullimonas aquatilis]|uniref:phage baseplate assembly protein n=1 Tax=Ampullimonas aquatilis TaxID=1341549 RepID=UPI003C764098
MADNKTSTLNNVRLLVAGKEYGGWKSVRIEAGIERQSRSFDLEITTKWPGNNTARPVQSGDSCEVFIGNDKVLTGFIDATPIQYDGSSIRTAIRGRSKTADLVDCCPITNKGQWRNQKLESIAAELAKPYGIKVVTEIDTGAAIPDHQIQPGESVFESIDRLMRLRHVLSTDNENGDLVFIDVGSKGRAGTALELGQNIRSASADLDYKDVYSEYICKGQRPGTDDSADTASHIAESMASIKEPSVKRTRVLVIKQSGQADEGTCADRVDYERAHRAAKAKEANYTVAGWRQASGALWLPNMLVQVKDPVFGLNGVFVIAEVAWLLDVEGLRTDIKVGPVDGYVTPAAKRAKQKKAGKGGAKSDLWADVQ